MVSGCFKRNKYKYGYLWASLVVQLVKNPPARWVPSTAGAAGVIPDQGTKTPHAGWCGQKLKLKKTFLRNKTPK